jgi:diacylglycerol kinase family enzyme
MRIVAVVNRGAGSVGPEVTAEALRGMFREAGAEAEVHFLPGERIAEVARDAAASGADAVVAGGGDGTIRAVASALVGGSVPLGVLPLGTLNHFARDLGIPAKLAEAVRLIQTKGEVHSLDVGEVNGEVFINNSMLGVYPPIVKVRDWERRELERGKWLATASAAVKVLPRLRPLHVRIRSDGWEIERRTRFVFVGNNEYEMKAFNYSAPSRFESGSLYLYLARSQSRLGLLGLALLGLVKDVKKTPHLDCRALSAFTIETPGKAVPVYLDGEVTTLQPPLVYRVRPRELRVIVPPPEA